MVLNLGERSP